MKTYKQITKHDSYQKYILCRTFLDPVEQFQAAYTAYTCRRGRRMRCVMEIPAA